MCVMFERILLRCFRSRDLDPIGFFAQFFALKSLSVLLMAKKLRNVSKNGDKRALTHTFLTLSVITNSKFVITCLQII